MPVVELPRVEALTLEAVTAVLRGEPSEDDRVELKADWPKPGRDTARKIAGHANASGGVPVFWIIGVDERGRRLRELDGIEVADWWAGTRRWFAEEHPSMQHLIVSVQPNARVVVLAFSTDRAPYLVNTEGGQVQREVPWREGNSTRTAHRHELLRSVVSQAAIPVLQTIEASVQLFERIGRVEDETAPRDANGIRLDRYGNEVTTERFKLSCTLRLYLSAPDPVTLPEHRQSLTLRGTRLGAVSLDITQANGTYRLGGYTDSGMRRREPSGGILVLGTSGLEVGSSGELELSALAHPNTAGAAALRRARRLWLDVALPVDLTDRTSATTVELRHVPGSGKPLGELRSYETWQPLARFTATVPSHVRA